jgi:carbon monoxide dehydrogenase subunit G
MRKVSAVARIDAPPPAVFEFVADLGNLPRWQSGIVSAQLLTPGPVGPGSRARVVRELLGQSLTVELALVEHRPPSRLELESEASGIGVRATLDLEAEGEATRLTFGMEIKARNVFMAPMEGMVAGAAERDIADSLERIRSHFAEGRPAAG